MSIQIADRLSDIKPSPTLTINSRAKAMKAEGIDVISMGVGEPDFNTPEVAKQAGVEAINNNQTRYSPVDGTADLKTAIIEKLNKDNNIAYKSEEIIVGVGAKQILFDAVMALLNPGDEAIICAPYWVSYPAMITMAGGKTVVIEAGIDQNYKITPDQLETAITDNTRLFIINSPSNPSGMLYTKEELEGLAAVLKKHPQVVILTDDIYEKILWDGNDFHNLINADSSLFDRTVVINGLSKSHAMTGWRVGYGAGPKEIIGPMKKVQSHNTSGTCTISQYAAAAALRADEACIDEMRAAYKARHDYMVDALNAVPGFKCIPTDGTFYLFPHVEEAMAMASCKTDVDFSAYLLNVAHVAVVPGSAFGLNGSIRFSIALSMEQLHEAIARIQKAMQA